MRLFELPDSADEGENDRRIKKVSIPPHLLLKSMIRKGLTATSNSLMARPKTAQSAYKYSR
jgi:hypothetical protein